MSAYEELTAGVFGSASAELFYSVTRAAARMNNFPPPEGHGEWDDTAVAEVVHEYLVPDGVTKLQKLLVRVIDEESLRLSVQRAMRNHLSDLARKTVGGRISRAIRNRLTLADDVESLGGSGSGSLWMIRGGDRSATMPSTDELVAAAYSAPGVRQSRFPVSGGRGAALIDPKSLERVLLATLQAANSPVTMSTLLQVVEARFPLVFQASLMALDDALDDSGDNVEPALVGDEADFVWEQLDLRERLVLPVIAGELTIREAAELLGFTRSTVHRAVGRARAVLESVLDNNDSATAVVAELLSRASQLTHGTPDGDLPSLTDEGRST